MDDDDEIRSQSPPPQSDDRDKPSPESPPDTGRVSVTVAAAAPPSTTVSNEISPVTPAPPSVPLTLALPMQQPSSTPAPRSTVVAGGGIGGGREDCWSDAATSVLIDAWGERYTEHSRGNLKQKHWQEVADIVSSREDDPRKPPKTDIQCKNRIDTVKKKYKSEKAKVAAGCGPSRWPFYERLDRLIGPTAAAVSAAAQKNIPVGIPVGVRQPVPTIPVSPYSSNPLQRPPHLQQGYTQQQQPQMRHGFATPFPQPQPSQRFNHSGNLGGNYQNSHSNSNNNHGSVGRMGSLNAIGRQQVMLQQQQYQHQQQLQQQQEQLLRRKGLAEMRPPVDSDSEGEQLSYDSGDSLPPEMGYERRKRPRVEAKAKKRKGKRKEVKVWGNSVRELTRAILKFGESYEAAESAKLEHVVEMEKQRMKFAKELELQRMKFLMKTQLELSQLNGSGSGNSDSRGGGSSGRRDGGGDGNGDGGGGEESNHVNHLSGNNENHVDLANSDSSN